MSREAEAGQSLTLDPDRRPRGRAWTVFTTSVLVYVVAVAGRTSFSVAVPLAGDRFGGGSAVLALFVVLQLGVYALAQVPVGLLLDRFGSRRVLACGALVVAAGQVGLALAHSLPAAILARVLVGAGDATAFIGAIRLIPAWFALGRVPIMTQLVSILGQLGQIVSAFPFLSLLHRADWSTAFTVMGGVGVGAAVLGLALIRDSAETDGGASRRRAAGDARESVWATMAAVARQPGTWLGFFSHWTGMFPMAVFTLMWGLSWMTEGMGLATSTASWAITVSTGAGIVGGLLAGTLSVRLPGHRSTIVLSAGLASLAAWTVALLSPSHLLSATVVACVCGMTGPFSGIGLDSARSFNEPHRWGTCTGMVNVGGFTATILAVELVGVVLDATGGRTDADFRVAFAATAVVWAVGMGGVAVSRALTRRRMRDGAVASF